jgi:hypothetical protein
MASFWYIKSSLRPGDVNGDGEVGISDVNFLISTILYGPADAVCDVNGDGEINIADVNTLINIILSAPSGFNDMN